MRALLFFAGSLLLASVVRAAPDLRLIDAARMALVECQVSDLRMLDPDWLELLAHLQRMALHAEQAHDILSIVDLPPIAILRRTQRFELSDVFAAHCQALTVDGQRDAFKRMRTGEPEVVREIAWVPLLTAGGEYLGAGLKFVLIGDDWRWANWENKVLGRSAETHALSLGLGAVRKAADLEAEMENCGRRLPKAPMPWPKARLFARPSTTEVTPPDASNALGAAQRLAALRYAEGRGAPVSPVAKVILAEVLLRSLDFANAPQFPSEAWRRRVMRAETLIAEAKPHSIDWQRMAPVLLWLARAHENGASGLSIDPTLAMSYRELAASTQDPEVLEMIARSQHDSWIAVPPADNLYFEMPIEPLSCE